MCPPQPAPAAHPNCCPPQFAPAAAPQDPTKPSTKKPSTFPGTELLYSRDAVTIRVVKDGKKPWKMAAGAGIPYVTYKIGSDLSLGQLCARLGTFPPLLPRLTPHFPALILTRMTGHDVAKTTVIEALEIGNGRWAPGKSTKVADNKAKTLAEMGWEGKRDAVGGLGPVWMVIKVA